MVEVLPFHYEHTLIAGRLFFVHKHNDPNDLAIIAHAIAEGMPIITCDDKFAEYKSQGAVVVHNPR
ncbi:PIN domain-containing protein [Capnocytophaga leadbetteri]|uniref:PIN domain-containing protein n=1 Tax=Capnocytophaga leadbetteri TaxID=327575 RepID=UPI0028ED21DB|nr:PIN domain-containing protein [Capnocytophaga leadbetteri]